MPSAALQGNVDLQAQQKVELDRLLALKAELAAAEEAAWVVGGIPRTPEGGVDYTKDFFGRPA